MKYILLLSMVFMIGACQTSSISYHNKAGAPSSYFNPNDELDTGFGLTTKDINTVSNKVVKSILANPSILNRSKAPRIQLDDSLITNESSARFNKNIMAKKLLVGLNQAAGSRLVFVSRENIARVEKERALKRQGVVDGGTVRKTGGTFGVDFALYGTVASLDRIDRTTGHERREYTISFELIDLESGSLVWTEIITDLGKQGANDVVYR